MDADAPAPAESVQAKANNQVEKPGCMLIFLIVAGAASILFATLIEQIFFFSIEQSLFLGDLTVADIRWVLSLVYAAVLLAPLLILLAAVRHPLVKSIFRTWALAALFVLLLTPARLIFLTHATATALAQAGGLIVFTAGLLIWRGRKLAAAGLQSLPIGLAAGLILMIPWVLWGALGSPFDTAINLLVAILFGVALSLLLELSLLNGFLDPGQPASPAPDWGLVQLYGLGAAVAAAVMLTGMGQNGNQHLLAISVPMAAWGAVALLFSGRGRSEVRRVSSWPAAAGLMALAIAGPLLFIDADELSLGFSGGVGETIQWASMMMGAAFGIGFILAVILPLLVRPLWSSKSRLLPVWILTPILFVTLGLIFISAGRAGFYGDRLFVILKTQADVSAANSMQDPSARRDYVYQALVKTANETQTDLRTNLSRLGIGFRPYYLVNGLVVNGGPLVKIWLENQPGVDQVIDNPILRPLPGKLAAESGSGAAPVGVEWNLKLIKADQVWEKGINGQGILIGQSDTGVQGDHPELADSYRGKDGQNDYNWYDPYYGSREPVDIGGHGTHTLGIVLGKNVGVAPGANWIACANMGRNLGAAGYYLDCWQFLFAPFPQTGDPFKDGIPGRGANIFTNSWGCPNTEGCAVDTFSQAVSALKSAGVFVVAAAGNSGDAACSTVIDPPATYEDAYSVGAIDRFNSLAPFSSVGPVNIDGSGRLKPDITAPGMDVLSAFNNNSYASLSGTSMAAPHVAGVVALMWSANPSLIGQIDLTEQILDDTAQPSEGSGAPACIDTGQIPNNAFGYGILDADAAVSEALKH